MIDGLIKRLGERFCGIRDHRAPNSTYYLSDSLKAAFAMFSLKDPSLLAFRENYPIRSDNLRRVYDVEVVPGDTAMRESLDGVDPAELQALFNLPWQEIRTQGLLADRRVLDGRLAISVDGTGHYASGKISCPHCLVQTKRGGEEQYYHQLLAAVQVHPEQSEVFALDGEAIRRQDGSEKNDCEQNAAKRLIPRIGEALPEERLLYLLDGLYATGPFVHLLEEQQAAYLITIKEGYVLLQAERLDQQGQLEQVSWTDKKNQYRVRFASQLILNGANPETLVNYLEYEQVDRESGKRMFKNSWITNLEVKASTVREMVGVARARWKIENETFNTLKNQGYNLEHNYGHGKRYLATNFALLMLLAFLVDQVAQAADRAFQAAQAAYRTKRAMWEKVQQVFDLIPAKSMSAIYRFVATKSPIDYPLLE